MRKKVQQIVTGVIEENCYLISNDRQLLIVDPGADAAKIKHAIEISGQQPLAILLTHTHYDHIGAVEEIRQAYHIPVYVSSEEQEWLGNPLHNLSGLSRHDDIANVIVSPAEFEFQLGSLTIGDFQFEVVATPGHSFGSLSFIFAEDHFVITGDALFKESIGRTDLYTGDLEQLLTSIHSQLLTLPDDFICYPGHRDATTIGHERNFNPYLQ